MSKSRSASKDVDLIGFDGSDWLLNDPEVDQHRSEPSNEGAGKKDKKAAIKSAITTVLSNVGEDPEKEGLVYFKLGCKAV